MNFPHEPPLYQLIQDANARESFASLIESQKSCPPNVTRKDPLQWRHDLRPVEPNREALPKIHTPAWL